MLLQVSSHAVSDIGLVRNNNEDSWSLIPQKKSFLIADGMGGHLAGEIASLEAIQFVQKQIENHIDITVVSVLDLEAFMRQAIIKANESVWLHSRQDPACHGMGTTLCCLCFHENSDSVVYGHVGDSRIYLLRDGSLQQITHDHSLLNDLIDSGELSPEKAKSFPHKNILTMAIGTHARVNPSVYSMKSCKGDIYMMCTDGLSDYVDHELLQSSMMAFSHDLEALGAHLVDLAKKAGGYDNITVVLARLDGPN